ncbi:DNA methyltransferase [Thomasclavelia ramosa]|nr:DNA methyltransferase [Thomasclavelia ramosa]
MLEEIIGYISLPYEIILDQFAGSSNLAVAALNMSRNAIVIEGVENI